MPRLPRFTKPRLSRIIHHALFRFVTFPNSLSYLQCLILSITLHPTFRSPWGPLQSGCLQDGSCFWWHWHLLACPGQVACRISPFGSSGVSHAETESVSAEEEGCRGGGSFSLGHVSGAATGMFTVGTWLGWSYSSPPLLDWTLEQVFQTRTYTLLVLGPEGPHELFWMLLCKYHLYLYSCYLIIYQYGLRQNIQ